MYFQKSLRGYLFLSLFRGIGDVNASPKQEPVIGRFRHIVKWEERKTKDKKRRRETRKRLERVLVSNDV